MPTERKGMRLNLIVLSDVLFGEKQYKDVFSLQALGKDATYVPF